MAIYFCEWKTVFDNKCLSGTNFMLNRMFVMSVYHRLIINKNPLTKNRSKMMTMVNKVLDWIRSLFWKEEMELTLVGLQNSGTFVNVTASGQLTEDMIPTVGFNMRKITKGNVTIKLWDIGCQPNLSCKGNLMSTTSMTPYLTDRVSIFRTSAMDAFEKKYKGFKDTNQMRIQIKIAGQTVFEKNLEDEMDLERVTDSRPFKHITSYPSIFWMKYEYEEPENLQIGISAHVFMKQLLKCYLYGFTFTATSGEKTFDLKMVLDWDSNNYATAQFLIAAQKWNECDTTGEFIKQESRTILLIATSEDYQLTEFGVFRGEQKYASIADVSKKEFKNLKMYKHVCGIKIRPWGRN